MRVEELKAKRDNETDKVLFIGHNKVVSYSKSSEPKKTGVERDFHSSHPIFYV